MVSICVTGAAGRMGTAIISSILSTSGVELVGALEAPGSRLIGKDAGEAAGGVKTGVKITDDREKAYGKAEVIIDFSHPDVTIKILEDAVTLKKALVIGTTGFSHQQRDTVKMLSEQARVVMSPNMSVGVNVLFKLVRDAALAVGDDYDVEIVEYHHRHKKDAPSGTAVRIAEVLANALGRDLDKVAVYERKGIIGERRPEEIGIQSIRAGDIIGDHTVMLAGPGERLELVHRASSRDTFAAGAVRAARWVVDKPYGLYDMHDVLGLK